MEKPKNLNCIADNGNKRLINVNKAEKSFLTDNKRSIKLLPAS
jgi:hypothetical protein